MWCTGLILRCTYKTIPTTCLRPVKSTNLSSVGSRRSAYRRTMTICWSKNTALCISQASKSGMASRSTWLVCQIIKLSWCGNYTLSKIWDGMTITNALPNTQAETSSKASDGWCGWQPTLSISFTHVNIPLTAIRRQNTYIPKCTLQTGGGKPR